MLDSSAIKKASVNLFTQPVNDIEKIKVALKLFFGHSMLSSSTSLRAFYLV